jgi:hypothetical protein
MPQKLEPKATTVPLWHGVQMELNAASGSLWNDGFHVRQKYVAGNAVPSDMSARLKL